MINKKNNEVLRPVYPKSWSKGAMIFLLGILLVMSFLSAASYMRTNYYSGSGASFVDSSSYYLDKQTCEAGEDFLIQIAPFGCTPAVVRSDLLEEQNIPIFCQLAATKINPLIEVDAIESISFSGQYPREVSGVGFHPARAALGVKGDLNSPILNNIGYAVIVLKKNDNESSMPDFVTGNLTAKIKYDINNAFGIGRASFYLPEMTDAEFTNNKPQYSFWEKKGYLRAESIDNEGAVISVYDKDRKVASVELKKGETSGKISLPTLDDCLAKLQLKLDSFENPDTRAKLNINGETVEVGDEEWFLENRCQVKEITKQGVNEKVTIKCKEDESSGFFSGSSTFNLMISPRVNLTICDYNPPIKYFNLEAQSGINQPVNCRTETHTVGDLLYQATDGDGKFVYLGYVESKKENNQDVLYAVLYAKTTQSAKLSDDEIDAMARHVRLTFFNPDKGGVVAFNILQTAFGKLVSSGLRIGAYTIKGDEVKIVSSSQAEECVLTKQVKIIGFAEPVDVDLEKLGSSSGAGDKKPDINTQRTDIASRAEKVLKENGEKTEGVSDELVIGNYRVYLAKKGFGNDEVEVILNAKECSNCGDGVANLCGAQECAEVGKLLGKSCDYEFPSGCKDRDKEKVDLQKIDLALQGITELIVKYKGESTYSSNKDIRNFVDELGASEILTERELEEIKGKEEFGIEGSFNVGEKNLNEIEDILQDKKSISGNVISGMVVSETSTSTSPTDIKTYYKNAIKDYDTIIESFASEKIPDSDVSYGEEALSKKIELGFALGQKKTIIDWCNQFKEKYPESKKTLSSFCQDKSNLASSSISSRDISINGRIKQISLEGIYEPSADDYSADILVKGPDGNSKTYTLTKDQLVYLDDFRKETLFSVYKTGASWSIYFIYTDQWYFTNDLNSKPTKVSEFEAKFCKGEGGDVLASTAVDCGVYEPYKSSINSLVGKDLSVGKKYISDAGGTVSRTNEFIQLVDLDDSYAVLNMNLRPEGYLDGLKQAITSTRSKLNDKVPTSFGSGYVFTLAKVNLKKSAKVSVIPSIDNAGTETSFGFKVGIDKRDIHLSPEKTREKIASLNETIKKWEERSEKLGNVVKGLKASCLGVGAFLTVKNLYLNTGGKAIARQEVMRGDGGWYDRCAKLKGEGKYSSINHCLNENSDAIDRDVSRMEGVIKEQNNQIQLLQKKLNCQTTEFLTETHVDDNCVRKGYSEIVKNEVMKTCEGKVNVGLNEEVDCSTILAMINENSTSIEQLRRIQLNSRLDTKTINTQLNKDLAEVYVNNKEAQKIIELNEKAKNDGLVGASFKVGSTKKTITEYYDGYVVPQGVTKGSITKDMNLQGYVYKGKEYYLGLKESGGDYFVENVYDLNGNILYESSASVTPEELFYGDIKTDPNVAEIRANLVFKKFDSSSYSNKYESSSSDPGVNRPILKYYETEPYAGLPALIPFDCINGWYVSVQQVTGVAGGLTSYDASGVARNYYICNVGGNKKEENRGGDDVCRMINKGTGQPYDVFPGLGTSEANKLFRDAESAIVDASKKYKSSGSGDVKIGNCNVKIGSPAVDIPDMQCQDFMSPGDCNLMFNVCDPVVCPSSRCDFGGTYPVKDVIQSGIIGSALLCLPNAREGIKIPVCLSGIKAGIDGLLSVYHSYRDCLQESLDTGKMIGICDEIYSIHMCEFFWRQSLPLAKIIIPKMMEIALGQNVRGGGEYMGVATAWANAEKSIDYFAQYYAATSYQAFKARIVEGVGDAVCQNSISASYPDGGSVLDSLTDPDSPPQFHGRFDEIEFTTATNPPISQYKVYYHIYAGKESRAYFQVYLKGDTGSSFYQDVSGKRPVASGYIATGEYASETKDFTAPSGYKQLCINVNGQEECGFQEVSTSFAINYVEDKYKEEQALQTDIKSEQECVSGSASAYSLLTPNLQSAGEELINPEIYNHGIIRICATNNPGKGTDGNVGTNASRWVEVGYCDKTNNIRCWQDEDSVKNTIKSLDIEGNVLKTQSENTLKILMDEGKYITDFKTLSDEIDKLGGVAKIDKITSVINRVFYNAQKAYLYLKRGDEYGKLAGVGKSRSDSEKTATVESPEKPAVVEPISGDSGVGDGENGLIELSTAPYQCGNLKVMGEKYQRAVGEYVILTINQKEENGKLKLTEEMRNSVMVDTKDIRNFKCLVLQQAFQESCLAHCLYAEDKDTYDYCNNNLDTIVKGDDSNSIGVMQLNNKYFDQSKSVDIGWNINEGIDYLITSYNYCKNNQGVSNWNAALNRYNGLGCKVDADYSTKVLGRKDEVDKLFPELCGDGTSTNPEGETTIPGISPGMVEPNGEVAI